MRNHEGFIILASSGSEKEFFMNQAGPGTVYYKTIVRGRGLRVYLILILAVLAVLAASIAGYYYWDAVILALLVALAWLKKWVTLGALWTALKKAPYILVLGSKKLIVKILGGFLLFAAHSRFRIVRRFIVGLKFRSRTIVRRVKFHWGELSLLERTATIVAAIPVTVLIGITLTLLALMYIPKVLISFLSLKLKEESSAKVLKRAIPGKIRDRVSAIGERARKYIRKRLRLGKGKRDKPGDE